MAGVEIKAFQDQSSVPALEMNLTGEVGYDITVQAIQEALVGQGSKPLTVNLYSCGGNAIEGIAIYTLLSRHQGKKRVVIDGLAASAASVIAMAGDDVVMPENSFLMIHECWSGLIGNSTDLRKGADLLDRISASYADAYKNKSGLPYEEVLSLMRNESWLTAAEALEFGFADEIAPAAKIKAAIVPEGRFRSIPQSLTDKIQPAVTNQPSDLNSDESLDEPPVIQTEDQAVPRINSDEIVKELELVSTSSSATTTLEVTEREALVAQERQRAKQIRGLCEQVQAGVERAEQFIDAGMSIDEVRAELFTEITGKRKVEFEGNFCAHGHDDLGLSKKEKQRYSMIAVAKYLADPNPRSRDSVGFELEVSRAAEAKHGRSAQGVLVPHEVLSIRAAAETPGQTVGTFSDGGALVGTNLLSSEFIDFIRAKSAFMNSGITVLSGLEGNVEIPKKSGTSTWYMVGENVDVSSSKLTFGTVNMIPRSIGVRVPISRRMLNQSSLAIEALVRSDMGESLSQGMDKNIGYGTGTNNRPLGISRTPGIGSVTLAGGTSLAVSADLGGGTHDFGDWADYVALETSIFAANLDVSAMRYIGNSFARGALKTTLRSSGSSSDYILKDDGTVNGYEFVTSNQVEQNDVFFGNMNDVVVGMWGGLDVVLDNLTQSANGQVILTVMQDFDVAVRRPQSFALGT